MPRNVLIAIGGNALIHEGEGGSIEVQSSRARDFAETIADLVEDGWTPVITHGNGPQVGFILRRGELARTGAATEELPDLPLWLAVADSQGGLGHIIASALHSAFDRRGIGKDVAAILTHTVVDEFDPAFGSPTKPIGGWLDEDEAQQHKDVDGWELVEVDEGTFRRVVASPHPQAILEVATIKSLVAAGVVVIAAGGGGIPVIKRGTEFQSTDAVIDKDRASALLAAELKVSALVLVTGVDRVFVDFGQPAQRALDIITVNEAHEHLEAGQFPAGSMGPKVESAIEFVSKSGSDALITSIEHLRPALRGVGGTRIVSGATELADLSGVSRPRHQ